MSKDLNEAIEPVHEVETNTPDAAMLVSETDPLQVEMPAVQDHAIAAALERLEGEADSTVPEAAPQVGDSGGSDAWDPAVHEDPPRRNRDGQWAKLRGKRPASGKPASPKRSFVNTKPDPKKEGEARAQKTLDTAPLVDPAAIQASAVMSAGLFFAAGQMLGGEEFKPDDKGEQDGIVAAFTNYYTAKGCPDIPPGIALAAGLGLYVAKRWTRPVFTEKRQTWFQKIKALWAHFRLHRQLQAEEHG